MSSYSYIIFILPLSISLLLTTSFKLLLTSSIRIFPSYPLPLVIFLNICTYSIIFSSYLESHSSPILITSSSIDLNSSFTNISSSLAVSNLCFSFAQSSEILSFQISAIPPYTYNNIQLGLTFFLFCLSFNWIYSWQTFVNPIALPWSPLNIHEGAIYIPYIYPLTPVLLLLLLHSLLSLALQYAATDLQ